MDYIHTKPKIIPEAKRHCQKTIDDVQMFNNKMFINGYFILSQIKESGDKSRQAEFSKVCKKIREYDQAYRGNQWQRGGYDTIARKECEKMGYSKDQIVGSRAKEEPKDHAKAAANDREPAYQGPVGMFSNAKTVKMF